MKHANCVRIDMDVSKLTDMELGDEIKKLVLDYLTMPIAGEVKEDSLLGELITELKKRRQNIDSMSLN
jgi:hypothetical protein